MNKPVRQQQISRFRLDTSLYWTGHHLYTKRNQDHYLLVHGSSLVQTASLSVTGNNLHSNKHKRLTVTFWQLALVYYAYSTPKIASYPMNMIAAGPPFRFETLCQAHLWVQKQNHKRYFWTRVKQLSRVNWCNNRICLDMRRIGQISANLKISLRGRFGNLQDSSNASV